MITTNDDEDSKHKILETLHLENSLKLNTFYFIIRLIIFQYPSFYYIDTNLWQIVTDSRAMLFSHFNIYLNTLFSVSFATDVKKKNSGHFS